MRAIGIRTLLLLVLTGSILCDAGFAGPAATAQAGPLGTATATDRLNLRSGPSLADAVIAVIPVGAKVTLTGQDVNGFRSVTYQGRSGWAFGAYLSIDAPTPSPNTTAVTTARVNLRSGPGTSFAVVTVLPAGATVTVTGQSQNGFRSVTWGGFTGWVSSTYLDFGAPPPAAPTRPGRHRHDDCGSQPSRWPRDLLRRTTRNACGKQGGRDQSAVRRIPGGLLRRRRGLGRCPLPGDRWDGAGADGDEGNRN